MVIKKKKKKMADIPRVSRVRTTAESGRMAKTARRQLAGRHLLFGEYLRSKTNLLAKRTLSKMNFNIDAGNHVLAICF